MVLEGSLGGESQPTECTRSFYRQNATTNAFERQSVYSFHATSCMLCIRLSVRKWSPPLRPHPPSPFPPTNQWSRAPFRSAARVLSRARRFAPLGTGVDNFFELATPDHLFFSFDESMNSRLKTLQAPTWRRLTYACTGNMLRQES